MSERKQCTHDYPDREQGVGWCKKCNGFVDACGWAHPRQEARVPSQALFDVAAERRRQIEAEGWTPEHDDAHDCGQMAGAAACYVLGSGVIKHWAAKVAVDTFWPWAQKWRKPTDPRRDLVKAGALILAEIERLDRAAAAEGNGNG